MRWKISTYLLLGIFLSGCAASIRYVGNSYPPTSQVDFYYDSAEIKKSYVVMGTFESAVNQSGDFNEMIEKLKAEARKHGADAILIAGIQAHNEKATDSTATEKNADLINQTVAVGHSKLNYPSPGSVPYNELKGSFIKYK